MSNLRKALLTVIQERPEFGQKLAKELRAGDTRNSGPKMVGVGQFTGGKKPNLFAIVVSCFEYDSKLQKMVPKISISAKPQGASQSWMRGFSSRVRPRLEKELTKQGLYPSGKDKKNEICQGVAEIGGYYEQAGYSDDRYLIVRADEPRLAKIIVTELQHALPVSGGGVPGALGYKGSGIKKTSDPGVWIYHYSSFGVGD